MSDDEQEYQADAWSKEEFTQNAVTFLKLSDELKTETEAFREAQKERKQAEKQLKEEVKRYMAVNKTMLKYKDKNVFVEEVEKPNPLNWKRFETEVIPELLRAGGTLDCLSGLTPTEKAAKIMQDARDIIGTTTKTDIKMEVSDEVKEQQKRERSEKRKLVTAAKKRIKLAEATGDEPSIDDLKLVATA